VGLDILAAIGADQYARLPEDHHRESYRLPSTMQSMIDKGLTGEKEGAGFYKRDEKSILTYHFDSGENRPKRQVELPVGDAIAKLALPERLAALRAHGDEPGLGFLNEVLDSLARYVEYVTPDVTDSPSDVDRVMRWGFGWEIGPHEMITARKQEPTPPGTLAPLLRREGQEKTEWSQTGAMYVTVADFKSAVVLDSPTASLVDIGDGVACLEFHTKMNTFSPDQTGFVDIARERAEKDFRALVIANDAPHFSAGYNLNLFLKARAVEAWVAIEVMLYDCQCAFMRLKYSKVPVVGAPHGYTLGAGCECSLHCDALVAAPELYMGLPEASVGVVPAGGGTKEMLVRAMSTWDGKADPFDVVLPIFERLAFPRNSTSAEDARRSGFLRPVDVIVRNADRQVYEAKQKAIELAQGYQPPPRPKVTVLGHDGYRRLQAIVDERLAAGSISEYDAVMALHIAKILCGGDVDGPVIVDEDALLKLERDVFIEAVEHKKSAERLEHVLETGKPLKN